jgi:hypothetical protein
MGAELNKPYTEIEFMGKIYSLKDLRGGHNGRNPDISPIVKACQTNSPVFDPATGLWRVPVTNNFIQLSADNTPLGRIRMGAPNGECEGYLEPMTPATHVEDMDFPVRSVFTFDLAVELLDLGVTLYSRDYVTVTADNVWSWPPPVGTVYSQKEYIELVTEPGGPTVATLRPDTTVITMILHPADSTASPSRRPSYPSARKDCPNPSRPSQGNEYGPILLVLSLAAIRMRGRVAALFDRS